MSIFLTALVGSATISSLVVCITAIHDQEKQKSAYFNLLAIATSCYMIGNLLEFTSYSDEAAIAGVKVAYLGIPFIPPLWYLCVREFCGVKIKNPLIVLGMMIIPLIISILSYTWESNHLLFSDFWYDSANHLSQIRFVEGPFYIVKQSYLHLFSLLGFLTIWKNYKNGSKKIKSQIILFLISSLIPIFSTLTYFVDIDSYIIDITPIALAYTMVLFFISIRKYGVQNFSAILKENIVDNLHEGVMLFDRDGSYMNSNKTAQDILPQLKNTSVGVDLNEMLLPFNRSALNKKNGEVIEFSKEFGSTIRTYSISVSHVKFGKDVIGYTLVIYNITPIKTLLSELELKAYTDPLTNIYNRGFLFEKTVYEIEKAKLAKNTMSLIIFDLDFFKKINDAYGHPCGDYVLKTVAQIGLQNLRAADTLGRYGGEEFCALLLNTNIKGASVKAETLREKIAAHVFEYAGNVFRITASFGVAEINHEQPDESINAILERADVNLYKAKESGRNKVVF